MGYSVIWSDKELKVLNEKIHLSPLKLKELIPSKSISQIEYKRSVIKQALLKEVAIKNRAEPLNPYVKINVKEAVRAKDIDYIEWSNGEWFIHLKNLKNKVRLTKVYVDKIINNFKPIHK